MGTKFFYITSIACALPVISCSDPPPTTASAYIAQTRALEQAIASYVNSVARNARWDEMRQAVGAQVSRWGDVEDIPWACRNAADALYDAVWATNRGWHYDSWHEAYVAYVKNQVDCETAVDGKSSHHVLQPELTADFGVPKWGS